MPQVIEAELLPVNTAPIVCATTALPAQAALAHSSDATPAAATSTGQQATGAYAVGVDEPQDGSHMGEVVQAVPVVSDGNVVPAARVVGVRGSEAS